MESMVATLVRDVFKLAAEESPKKSKTGKSNHISDFLYYKKDIEIHFRTFVRMYEDYVESSIIIEKDHDIFTINALAVFLGHEDFEAYVKAKKEDPNVPKTFVREIELPKVLYVSNIEEGFEDAAKMLEDVFKKMKIYITNREDISGDHRKHFATAESSVSYQWSIYDEKSLTTEQLSDIIIEGFYLSDKKDTYAFKKMVTDDKVFIVDGNSDLMIILLKK